MNTASLRPARHPNGTQRALTFGVPAGLLALAAVGWWWSARTAGDMASGDMAGGEMAGAEMAGDVMSFGAFVVAWVAMMAAMMFPAVAPAVRLFARGAAHGRAAPVPYFVAGYLAVWATVGVPAYLAWRALEMPLADGAAWAGRLAGATLLVAAVWQWTPLKSACLRHCRSPLGFFLRFGARIQRPLGALRMGAMHGGFCLGCCWAFFAVLVALGTMHLLWMAVFAVVIALEKIAPRGPALARVVAVALAVAGAGLIADPSAIVHVT